MNEKHCVHCGITWMEFLGSQIVVGLTKMCVPDRRPTYTHEWTTEANNG